MSGWDVGSGRWVLRHHATSRDIIGGSTPNEKEMDVFCLFGVFSCHFGRPQNLSTKLFSDILEGCIWMRFPWRAKKLAQWLRSRRSNSPLMGLMAHQNSLMLLFLLPQTSQIIDPSHKNSVSVEVDKQGGFRFPKQAHKPIKSDKIWENSEKIREKY